MSPLEHRVHCGEESERVEREKVKWKRFIVNALVLLIMRDVGVAAYGFWKVRGSIRYGEEFGV